MASDGGNPVATGYCPVADHCKEGRMTVDNISRIAMMAKQAGMSYGQLQALREPVAYEKKIPEGWIACEYCGKYFKPYMNKRFCDIDCRRMAYDAKIRKEKQNGQA